MYTKEQLPSQLYSDAFTVKPVLQSPSRFNQVRLRNKAGFTLIELMIVVAIIGIISSIAYPSYRESVRRTNRVAAGAILLENAQFMERFFTENSTYVGAVLPTAMTKVPKEGTKVNYNVSINGATATGYTLQAIPSAGGGMVGDDCGTLTLTNLGVRSAAGGSPAAGKSVAQCWGQ